MIGQRYTEEDITYLRPDIEDVSMRKKASPRLRATFIEIVDNQIAANDPPEARQTLERLKAQGISTLDAKLYIAQAIAIEIFDMVKEKQDYSSERYIANLLRLPEPPWDDEE